MDINFRIEGLEDAVRKMDKLRSLEYLKAILKAAIVHLQGKIAKYPPSSEANAPSSAPGSRWYERGMGTHYIRVRDGGHSIYRTSEMLGRSWTVGSENQGLTWYTGTRVSYARHVQDREKQAYFHKARGWITAQDVVEDERVYIEQFAAEELERLLSEE